MSGIDLGIVKCHVLAGLLTLERTALGGCSLWRLGLSSRGSCGRDLTVVAHGVGRVLQDAYVSLACDSEMESIIVIVPFGRLA